MSARVLVVRQDNNGDVLLTGPAVRAVAARADHVTMLCGPRGADAARMLPGVDDVLVWSAPWIDPEPPPVTAEDVARLVGEIRRRNLDAALVFTSFHQSPLPTALTLRIAGVPRLSAICDDYPGSLLDVRHRVDDDLPEAERACSLAAAAGFPLPAGDDGRLAVRRPLPDVAHLVGPAGYVVVHPGATVAARAVSPRRNAEIVDALIEAGHRVVVTGAPSERPLTASVARDAARDLGGANTFAELAAVLAAAAAVVVGNTGPAHLAAAVGTPVVSLFSPVVPAVRWAPYGVPSVLLGDQDAPCRGTRARVCPVAGHPCLESVTADEVRSAVEKLIGAE